MEAAASFATHMRSIKTRRSFLPRMADRFPSADRRRKVCLLPMMPVPFVATCLVRLAGGNSHIHLLKGIGFLSGISEQHADVREAPSALWSLLPRSGILCIMAIQESILLAWVDVVSRLLPRGSRGLCGLIVRKSDSIRVRQASRSLVDVRNRCAVESGIASLF